MSPEHLAEAARLLIDARTRRARLADLPEACRPRTTDDAEAICEAFAAGSEQPVGGWKVGCVDPGTPAKLGLERPFCGQIPASLIYPSGASVPHADLMRPVVEAEIAFRLGCDLPPREKPYNRFEVDEGIAALVPGIEIPESRLVDDHPLGALGMVADQGYAGRFVAGDAFAHWRLIEVPDIDVVLWIGGREVARGKASRAMGNPLDAVTWLANYRSRRGDGLKAGQIVSTGSLTGIHRVAPGDEVVADYGPLGAVVLAIA